MAHQSVGSGSECPNIQLAKSSRRINGETIFWSKSMPITVLDSCNITECYGKAFLPNFVLLSFGFQLNWVCWIFVCD